MKKYLFIYKSEVMTNLQYIYDVFAGFIGYFMILFIFLNLWKYIYSDPSEVINGYTMNQMVWYVIVTEVLWSILSGRKYCYRIANDVKGGNIAYNINKPYDYILYSLFMHLGECTIRGIIYIVLGSIVGFIFLGSFPSLSIISIIAVLLTCVLATVISTLLITFIGLFSFIIEDAHPFYWLYSKLILIIGVLFPIEFFPMGMQAILRYSPIYVVSYGPARLFVNFSAGDFIHILFAQIVYIFIGYGLCSWLYKRGVKRLNVNGG